MQTGFIYKLTNTVNGKVYIGQTISKVRTRWATHKRNATQGKNKFYITRAIAKYGDSVFKVETIAEVEVSLLDATEMAFIDSCRARDPRYGYNLRDGGSGYADEKSARISKAMTGRTAWNRGTKGQPAWNKGTPWSDEVKAKLSGPRKPLSEEHKAKLRKVLTPEQVLAKEAQQLKRAERNARRESRRLDKLAKRMDLHLFGKTSWNKGIPHSEETKRKLSEANLGKTPGNKGTFHKEETKAVMRAKRALQVFSPEVGSKIAESLRGQKRTEEQRRNISEACKGRKNSEEHKQKSRDAVKALWADPVYRERMLQSRREKSALRKAA